MTSAGCLHTRGKRALIVLGMHRSGTSATTGALQRLGVQLGRRLYSGHQNINAKGYFEHSDIADTNDEALFALGSGWDDIFLKDDGWWRRDELNIYAAKIRRYIRRDFSHSPLWAVKDPRVCRLLPWWLEILALEEVAPYFLVVVRSPAAVFRSLERRDGFSREKAYLVWSLHYLEAERWTRPYPRAFLAFDDFLEDPVGQLLRVEQALGLAFPLSVEEATDNLAGFLSRELRHHGDGGDQAPDDSTILAMARNLEAQLHGATQGRDSSPNTAALDSLWQRMEQLQRVDFTGPMAEHLRSVAGDRGRLQITMNRLLRSWSWYTGKPVRFLERLFGRDV
jgi:hypothetical protein